MPCKSAPRRANDRGHGNEEVTSMQAEGYCECGCGQQTTVYCGTPRRFIHGHNRASSPVLYVVDQSTGCWEWQRGKSKDGYGICTGGTRRAHAESYKAHVGPIPEGCEIDHLCRNRGCVNPDHLEAVTDAVNTRRGNVAKLTEDEVRAIRRSDLAPPRLAEKYGVTNQAIHLILKRVNWRDVA